MYRSPRPLPQLEALALDGRAVLLRADLNVPFDGPNVRSDARIRAALPTLRQLMASGARVAVASHLGRPKGRAQAAFGLAPVAERLSQLLGTDVVLAHDCVGDGVRALVQQLRPGQVVCLENLRFHAGEEAGDAGFARALARPFDVYVNDAFAVAHRHHASVTGVVPHIGACAAGGLLAQESAALDRLMAADERPYVACVGGAKVADKIGVLQALVQKADTLLIGGAMAYTFLFAKGMAVGRSRVEPDVRNFARDLLERAARRGCEVLLPTDHVAAEAFSREAKTFVVDTQSLPDDAIGLDIGPASCARFAAKLRAAATVFWNGPVGVYDWPHTAKGSHEVARAVADAAGYRVAGGGDTLAVLDALDLAAKLDHVSTGGGASLAYLQYGTLPGIEALRQRG